MRQFKVSLGAFAVIVVLLISQLLTASSAHAAASRQTNYTIRQVPTSAFSLQLPWPTGQQHKINGGYTYGCGDHTGRDYYAVDFNLSANSQVSAIMAGTAHTVYGNTGYGNYIWILHSGNFVSLYGHLNSFAIADGTSVSQGQLIGLSGSTGNSTGPHLHFTLHSNATTQWNGSAYKPEPMSSYTGFGNYGFCTGRVSPMYTSTSPTPSSQHAVPQAVVNQGLINIYFRGTDGALHQTHWVNGGWVTDMPSSTPMGGDPNAVVNQLLINIYFRGTDGALHQTHWVNGGWVTDVPSTGPLA